MDRDNGPPAGGRPGLRAVEAALGSYLAQPWAGNRGASRLAPFLSGDEFLQLGLLIRS
jgi:hypothetical protein